MGGGGVGAQKREGGGECMKANGGRRKRDRGADETERAKTKRGNNVKIKLYIFLRFAFFAKCLVFFAKSFAIFAKSGNSFILLKKLKKMQKGDEICIKVAIKWSK